jgi:hypothetical protein
MTTDPDAGGDLTDDALQDEIELVGDLVVAASASERQLTDEEIDQALGIVRGHKVAPPEEGGKAHRVWRRLHA